MSMWNNIICLGCLSGWGWFLLPSRFLMSTLTSLQRFTMAQIRVRQKKSSTWCEIRKGTCYSWPLQQTCRIDPVGVFMFRTCFGEKKGIKKIPFQNISKKKETLSKHLSCHVSQSPTPTPHFFRPCYHDVVWDWPGQWSGLLARVDANDHGETLPPAWRCPGSKLWIGRMAL